MKKIAIINVYGEKNIGDRAIYERAISVIKKAYGSSCEICSISVEGKQLGDTVVNFNRISPYGFAIRQGNRKLSSVEKIYNFIEVLGVGGLQALLGLVSNKLLPQDGAYSYITFIKNADVVINMGGGYLRTKSKYADFFGLITTLFPIWIAKLYAKAIVFLPMSFGEFASPLHDQLAFNAIKGSTFFARDYITYDAVKNHSGFSTARIKLSYSPDLALMSDQKKATDYIQKRHHRYLVISARDWMSQEKQNAYENALAEIVKYIFKKYRIESRFVAMANNSIEDDDKQVFRRLQARLKKASFFSRSIASTPQEVKALLKNAAFAVCTRMHSAIFASLVSTPFVTIQYEHKTLGFMKSLSLTDLNVPIEKATVAHLKARIDKVLSDPTYYRKVVEKLDKKKAEYEPYEKVLVKSLVGMGL